MNEGDSYILKSFFILEHLLSEYAKNVNEVCYFIHNFTMRITAIIDPKPQITIKVIKLPKSAEIAEEISRRKGNLNEIESEIWRRIDEMELVLKSGRFQCQKCEGKGKISQLKYIREDDFISQEVEYENCDACNGMGFVEISQDILETSNEALRSIKNFFK
jgi:hypothetical protein